MIPLPRQVPYAVPYEAYFFLYADNPLRLFEMALLITRVHMFFYTFSVDPSGLKTSIESYKTLNLNIILRIIIYCDGWHTPCFIQL